MGCTASKLENEDTVRRCKDRRRLMKDVVYARHQLAAAHSDYSHSLRLTGSALSTFAVGEPLSVSDHTPPSSSTTPTAHSTYSSTPSQTSSIWNWENFYTPPPPPASDYFPEEHQHQHQQKLSQAQAQTQTETPFLHSHKTQTASHYSHKTQPTNPQIHDSDSERSEYDYFDEKHETQKTYSHSRSPSHIHSDSHSHHHFPEEYTETEREEVQWSEWGIITAPRVHPMTMMMGWEWKGSMVGGVSDH